MAAVPQSTALVGRQRELERLSELLDAAAGGPAQVVEVVGEAGIGKSRLLFELQLRAREHGFGTLLGRASEFERDVPFAVWSDALRECEATTLAGLPEAQRQELSTVVPRFASAEPSSASLATSERYLLHRALAALLEASAAERPLVVALDDLHWADAASVEALLHLVERPPDASLLLVLAYRPRELLSGSARALAGAAQRISHQLELEPLSFEQALAFLPGGLSGERAERLWETSGGNPFYLEQLVRAGAEGQLVTDSNGQSPDGAVPAAVAAATAGELERLSEQARKVLRGAAVVGDRFAPDLAAVAAGISPDLALEVVDELVDHDVVRAAPAPGRFRFRHPILYQAVYQDAPPAWRLGAHARVARALAERGAPATLCASHVERFAQPGDAEALAVLEQAAQAATKRAPLIAARWYRSALELLGEDTDQAERRRTLLTGRAITLGFGGQLQTSSQVFGELLAELSPGPSPERTAVVRFASLVEHLLGNFEQASQLVLGQLDQLDPGASEARELEVELANGGFMAADWTAVGHWASKALAGELAGPLRAAALSLLALAQYSLGQVGEARGSADAARELVDGLSDAELLGRLEAVSMLAWAELCCEEIDRSLAHAGRGIRVSQEYGQEHLIVALQVVQALGLLLKGAFGRAADLAQDAIESSALASNQLFLCWALTTRCDVELQAGDAREAIALGERAQQAAAESRSPWASVAVPYLAEARLEGGDPERCLAIALDADGKPRLPPFPYYAPRCYETLARAELALGRPERAAQWATAAGEAAERIGLPGVCSVARRAQAEVALAGGDHERALALAQEGVALAEHGGLAVEAGRCRVLVGRALAAVDPGQAAATLGRAHEELSAQGAGRYRDQAAAALRGLGRAARAVARGGARGESSEGLEALSEREREVAQLVAAGHTSRQIADRLLLSPKTVTNHLTRIYRRLGLGSREELAALTERSRQP